jgi:2-polyprenyl-3-methyl-5-hydroxy-6-metoxy-1,4-benzoquinol methylase
VKAASRIGSADDWDAHWGDYASTAEDNPAQAFRRTVAFEQLERSGEPRRLFDIGAGQGDLLAKAHERWPEAELAGIELSATGIAEAARKVPSARVTLGNLLHDVVMPGELRGWATHAVCSEVLEHVDDPALLVRNARAFLAPGCLVVLTVPAGPRSAFDKHIGHRRHFDRATLEAVLDAGGLIDVHVEAAGFPVFNLYKLVVILRGKRLIADAAHADPSSAARFVMRAFDRLFSVAPHRGRFGWQLVATATSP